MGTYALDDLKLAFSLHVVDQIVAADDQLTRGELDFIEARFPHALLVEKGLVDRQGARTDAFHECAMSALERLPTALDVEEKLGLLNVFVEATVADEDFEPLEGAALVDAARLLGLSDLEIDAFLASTSDVGDASVESLDAAD